MKQWKIVDGGFKGPSRNGTWLFASKSFEIYDGLIFRVANSKVKVNLECLSESDLKLDKEEEIEEETLNI